MTTATALPIRNPATRRPSVSRLWSVASVRWAAVALALFVAGLVTQLFDAPSGLWWAFYLACYVTGGWSPAWEGLQALRSRTLDVDLLMVVAAIGAASIGQIFDGALLIVIFATSGALEDAATKRTEDSVTGLLDLAPDRAVRIDADGIEQSVNARDLRVGDLVSVRPGERIPADGTVVDGGSDVDQSSVTGEPLPVGKSVDDDVFAGTLNGAGALRIRVAKDPSDTVVARIVALRRRSISHQSQNATFHREDRTALFRGRRRGDPRPVRHPADPGSRPTTHAAPSDDFHDRGIAVCDRVGDDAAAALGHRQRRTPRSSRQDRPSRWNISRTPRKWPSTRPAP